MSHYSHYYSSLFVAVILVLYPVTTYAGTVWRISMPAAETVTTTPTGFWGSLTQWIQGRVQIVRLEIGTQFTIESTAYTPSPYETDSTPCITAAGTRVRSGVVASNFLPLGTILEITPESAPKNLPQNLFIVEDRMSSRFEQRLIDIWFPDKESALEFGRRKLTLEVVGYGTPGQSLETDEQEEVVETSIIKRANLRFIASARSLSRLLTAAVGQSQTVDCFATE